MGSRGNAPGEGVRPPEANDIFVIKIANSLLRVMVLHNFAIVNFLLVKLIIRPITTRMCDINTPNSICHIDIVLIVLGKFYYMQ